MGTNIFPGIIQSPYLLHRADNGAIPFEMIYTRVNNITESPTIILITKECPHDEVYMITFNYYTETLCLRISENVINIHMPKFLIPLRSQKFWISWYNDELCMGLKSEPPFLIQPGNSGGKSIGFIKLELSTNIDWDIKSPSIAIEPFKYKHVEGGKLHWSKVTNNILPPDALIGGHENEPIYIAQAEHNGSLCPGKTLILDYIHNLAGLCVAGSSEVNGEHLYIGRARINTDLVIGKVHMLYKTCYLPYQGSEIETQTYEILVKGDVAERGITCIGKCQINPMKAMQPCI